MLPFYPYLQQTRFTDMSDGLVERIDELGARIDELEHSITRSVRKCGAVWYACDAQCRMGSRSAKLLAALLQLRVMSSCQKTP